MDLEFELKDRLAKLNAAIDAAEGKWRVNSWQRDDAATSAALGALRQTRGLAVAKWQTRAGELIARGSGATQAEVTKWTQWGNDILHDINYYNADAETTTLAAILLDTVKASAEQVKDGAVDLGSGLLDIAKQWRWILALGLLAIGFFAYRKYA